MPEDDLITMPAAAERFGVTRQTLYRLHKRDLLPLYKRVGERADLLRASEVERALAQRRAPGWPKGRPRRTTSPAPAS